MRVLLIIRSVIRVIPGSIYLSSGTMIAAFVGVVASPAWAPLVSLAGTFCVVYGSWCSLRRYRALHRWRGWKP